MEISNLLELLIDYSPEDKLKITRGFAFANMVHKGQIRKSGEEYITHPLSVACILAQNHVDADTITAGLLHDVIEDGECVTKDLISSLFNPTIGMLVDGVTKMKKLEFDNDKQMTDEANMRKIVQSILFDVRIFQIKLADRLHNMRTLEFQPRQKQIEISIETMELFVPFAGLIGAYDIKMELQDLCFMYLKPDKYEQILKDKQEEYTKNRKLIREIIVTIAEALSINNIQFDFKYRDKNISELAKRIDMYGELQNVHDLYQIKLIVKDENTCYEVKNIIEKLFKVYNEKSKDYIKIPKTNLYEALHVSVFGPKDRMFQFQIMTSEMDKINSSGILAYWELHKPNNDITPAQRMQYIVEKFQFFRCLMDIENIESNEEFNRNVKNDILTRMIYVTIEDGRVIEIPTGSCLIDLAYKISNELGNNLIYGFINDKPCRNSEVLKNKDFVKLVCNKDFIGPKEDLSNICVTERAKSKIRKCEKGE